MSGGGAAMKAALGTTVAATGAAAILLSAPKLWSFYSQFRTQAQRVAEYEKALLSSAERLQAIQDDFVHEMEEGLKEGGESSLMMLPTYVTHMPTGHERGTCFAIDLGGTNFRVLHLKLSDKPSCVEFEELEEAAIPQEVFTGTGDQLFDFMAGVLKRFMDSERDGKPRVAAGEVPVVGFCFSFAMEQSALDSGKLITWTKGFTCEGVVGQDPVQLLHQALERAGRPCRVTALLNDTVGVIAAGRYYDPDTQIGMIIGTGTNACYVEKVGEVRKWHAEGLPADCLTLINMEWGGFSSGQLPRLAEDEALDADFPNTGQYWFEKMIAGMYLGDAARRVLLTLAQEVQLFGQQVPEGLKQQRSFSTADLAVVEQDRSIGLTRVSQVLQAKLGVSAAQAPWPVRRLVQRVCRAVALRSAQMAAAAISGVLRHRGALQQPCRVVVAVDGGVYDNYANYRHLLRQALGQALGAHARRVLPLIEFKAAHDGSGVGAAVLALAAAT